MNIPIDALAFRKICDFSSEHLILPHDAIRLFVGLPSLEPFLIPPRVLDGKKEVDRFLAVLGVLYHKKKKKFEEVAATLHGTRRKYFGLCAEEITSTGCANRASQIPETPWFVSTNNWGHRKAFILFDLMIGMGFSREYSEFISSICHSSNLVLPKYYREKLQQLEGA